MLSGRADGVLYRFHFALVRSVTNRGMQAGSRPTELSPLFRVVPSSPKRWCGVVTGKLVL